jgi:signal transduction histidine kinase
MSVSSTSETSHYIPKTEQKLSVPQGIDFATEVKIDRLAMLWKATLVICGIVAVFALTIGHYMDAPFLIWVGAPLIFAGACLLTDRILKNGLFDRAALVYAAGGFLAIGVVLASGGPLAIQVMPFFYVLLIFIVGLLLRPQVTLLFAFASMVATVVIPTLSTGGGAFFGTHQFFAMVLMLAGAILAAQVTGELYAITEWALLNYQRERRTNVDLFESRLQLQKSLQRSEALSEQLRQINQELESAREAAEAAKTFRGKFLANMSHELRTPLNAIIGFSETMLQFPMMYDDEPLPESYKSDLSQIYTSGRQLLHLINDILDLAKVDAGKLEVHMQEVELESIINAVLATANGLTAGKSIDLMSDLPSPIPHVWADETRVRQVLLNLYSNASKFTDTGHIKLVVKETKEGVQFSVSDTGCGIAPAELAKIFEEFEQAGDKDGRDPRAGSGLGLAIARQLVALMDGRIWAESQPGVGSTFHFVLQSYHHDETVTSETGSVRVVDPGLDGTTRPVLVPHETDDELLPDKDTN